MDKLTKQQKIIGLLVVLALLIIATNVIKNIGKTSNELDYKSITGEEMLKNSTRNYDRIVFVELEEIVTKFVDSYMIKPDATDEEKAKFVSYERYYNALEPKYKQYLSSKKYNEKAKTFLKNFEINSLEAISVKADKILKEVYKYDTNEYICILNNGKEGNKEYLGIKLITETNNWEIFYIE